ncbi:MAG: hypothetical protein SFY68_12775 [Candidatus Sumerlaeia bacterium]|nr:hypothetical protein [Candidatus Sumerlaeia bacterium]
MKTAASTANASRTTSPNKHNNPFTLPNISIEGIAELIGVTPLHPFWSVEQAAYIPARELAPVDHVFGENGPIQILSIEPLPGSHEVINLEVHRHHVFRITTSIVLVHNAFKKPNKQKFPNPEERPKDITPKGWKRRAAFPQAKRDAEISMSQQSYKVI